MQGNIHRSLGRRISGRETVYITQDIFQPERIGELSDNILHFLQESQYAVHRAQFVLQVGRHGSFAITDDAVILYFDLHIGSGGARISSHRKHMTQPQFIRKKTQLHLRRNATLIDIEQSRRRTLTCQYTIESHART